MKWNIKHEAPTKDVFQTLMHDKKIEDIETFMNGTLKNLSPYIISDGFELLNRHKNHKVRIIGDYDVDGVMSTYISYSVLKILGFDVDYHIPDRITEGYGICTDIIEQAKNDNISLLFTCDNGIAESKSIELARSYGIDVLLTDHHQVPFEEKDGIKIEHKPAANSIVLNHSICGAGVVFQFFRGYLDSLGINQNNMISYLPFVALATVCDVMDLQGDNRILVKIGLECFPYTTNVGLKSLINVCAIEEVTTYHLGFVLGPCINAAGRLKNASLIMNLLLETNVDKALEQAEYIKELNEERKEMTEQGLIEARKQMTDNHVDVVVLHCHESIAGIIAGKLKEEYHKPIFVFTKGKDCYKGSGRSITGYHMYNKITEAKEYFIKYGGHELAAGCSMKEENIERLRIFLNEHDGLTSEQLEPVMNIEFELPFEFINMPLIQNINQMEPFGKGNGKPKFCNYGLSILSQRLLGKNQNVVKLELMDPKSRLVLDGIIFGVDKWKNKETIDIVYTLAINEWNGYQSIQLEIKDYQ